MLMGDTFVTYIFISVTSALVIMINILFTYTAVMFSFIEYERADSEPSLRACERRSQCVSLALHGVSRALKGVKSHTAVGNLISMRTSSATVDIPRKSKWRNIRQFAFSEISI